MTGDRITVIIPSYQRANSLHKCLEALEGQTEPPYQVIVALRPEDLDGRQIAATMQARLPLVIVEVTFPGVVAALNAALQLAMGELVAFTDDDAVPHPDWLERFCRQFKLDPLVGGVGGRDQVVGDGMMPRRRTVGRVQWFGRVIGNHHLGTGPARTVDVLKGVNMSFRRLGIRGISFDTRLRGSGAQVHNEMGFCLAVRRRAWKLVYDPEILVNHMPGPRFDEDRRGVFSTVAVKNAVHNETLILLEHLPRLRRSAFLVWSTLIGSRVAPGVLLYPRLLVSEPRTATRRLLASLTGRAEGLKSFHKSRDGAYVGTATNHQATPSFEPRAARKPASEVTIVAHEVCTVGGMELQLAKLVQGLIARGYRVTVIARRCLLPSDPQLIWHRVWCPARPFPLKYLWFFIAGSWKVAQHRKGIVHATGADVLNRADVSTVHYCHHAARAKTRVVSMSRSNLLYWINAKLSEELKIWAERLCYRQRLTGHLVVGSRGVAREIDVHFPKLSGSVSVIPIGVDSSKFRHDAIARRSVRQALGISKDQFLAIFVGGDWERKGLRYAVEAVSITLGVALLVVGSGDEDRYAKLAQICGGGERIIFIGKQDQTVGYYSAADVLVLPTAYETFSLVAHEAAAAGLPLLVTRVNGVDEILTDGANGWFIERDPSDISSRLAALRDSPDTRREMGQRSREAVASRTWAAMVDGYVSLYGVVNSTHLKPPLPAAGVMVHGDG